MSQQYCYCMMFTQSRQQWRQLPAKKQEALPNFATMQAAAGLVLLITAAMLTSSVSAVSTTIPAHVHAPHHHGSHSSSGCGKDGNPPCPSDSQHHQQHEQQHHASSATMARAHPMHGAHPHTGEVIHHSHTANVHPHLHTTTVLRNQHIKGASSVTSNSHVASDSHAHAGDHHHDSAAAGGSTSCHPYGKNIADLPKEDDLDRPYGIDPATGREATAEDVAEDAIAAAAKKAGMEPLAYEDVNGDEPHMGTEPTHLGHLDSESATQGFRLSYTLSIFIKESKASHEVMRLTEFDQSSNHTLFDQFEADLTHAIWDVLPDGVEDVRALNPVAGNPLNIEVIIYPDLLIPEELNPTRTLIDTDRVMHKLEAGSLSHWFVDEYAIDEIQVMASPQNHRDIGDCAEAFPLHGHHGEDNSSGVIARSFKMAIFVVCPVLVGVFVVGQALCRLLEQKTAAPVLPKGYSGFDSGIRKSASGSSAGAVNPNVASIYAAPLDYYAGPYRGVYSSGGASSSRGSMPGASSGGNSPSGSQPGAASPFQDYSRYQTPCCTEGGAQQ